jgi:hypothetical protein
MKNHTKVKLTAEGSISTLLSQDRRHSKRFRVSAFIDSRWDLTMAEVLSTLESIPHDLEGYYVRVMQRIPQDRQEAAATIFSILLSAQRSLTDRELAVAFLCAGKPSHYTKHKDLDKDLRLSMSGYAKGVCRTLIKVTGTTIEIVHQSARTFLLELPSDPKYITLSRLHYNPIISHNTMSRICLGYLSLDDFCEVEWSFGLFDKSDRNPFLAYASRYWPYHLREPRNI